MENISMNIQFVNETVNSPVAGASTVGWYFVCIVGISLGLFILFMSGLPVVGFVSYGIAPLSYAAMWMSSLGSVAAGSLYALLQSIAMGGVPLLTVLLYIAGAVTLVVGASLAVEWLWHMWEAGAVHVPTWLVDVWDSGTGWVLRVWHMWVAGDVHVPTWLVDVWDSVTAWVLCVWHMWEAVDVHVPTWLVDVWDSATAWVLRVWHSGDGILGWWNAFVAWVQHLWNSVPVHLNRKLLY